MLFRILRPRRTPWSRLAANRAGEPAACHWTGRSAMTAETSTPIPRHATAGLRQTRVSAMRLPSRPARLASGTGAGMVDSRRNPVLRVTR